MLEKAGARYYDRCACFGGVSVEAEFRFRFRFRFEHVLVKNVIAMLVTGLHNLRETNTLLRLMQ